MIWRLCEGSALEQAGGVGCSSSPQLLESQLTSAHVRVRLAGSAQICMYVTLLQMQVCRHSNFARRQYDSCGYRHAYHVFIVDFKLGHYQAAHKTVDENDHEQIDQDQLCHNREDKEKGKRAGHAHILELVRSINHLLSCADLCQPFECVAKRVKVVAGCQVLPMWKQAKHIHTSHREDK